MSVRFYTDKKGKKYEYRLLNIHKPDHAGAYHRMFTRKGERTNREQCNTLSLA
jgi:hypothetical protein